MVPYRLLGVFLMNGGQTPCIMWKLSPELLEALNGSVANGD